MPLQKSFSEREHSFSKRPQWQRSKSNPGPGAPQPRPLAPVSSKTKNKLQQFQFLAPPDEADENDGAEIGSDGPSKDIKTGMDEPDKENAGISARAKATPSTFASLHGDTTPATRLVWQDLMGETRSPPKQDDEITANERILWDNTIESFASHVSPMIGRRGRKRARSSSPASSPSHPMPETPAVNVKKLSQALRTPNADPTLELWDRFALQGGNATSPTAGSTKPLFSHLLASSSPRPNKDAPPPSERSLRKSISCGTQWPKRRKTDRAGPVTTCHSQEAPNGDSKTSMVSALLKTVTGEINKSISLDTGRDRVPDSPSPAKRTQARRDRFSQSPSKRPRAINSPARQPPKGNAEVVDLTEEMDTETGGAAKCSSDYGDDDFDDDTLLELDASLYTIHEDDNTLVAQPIEEPVAAKVEGNDNDATTFDDDFGDMDDELLEAAEEILTKAASQQQLPNTNIDKEQDSRSVSRQAPSVVVADEEDDPYGDDFGDFDFDAAELAATQSMSASYSHTGVASLSTNSSQKARVIQRYLVTNVLESSYEDAFKRDVPEKVLVVQAEREHTIKTIHLREDWYETPANPKAFVHVIGKFESSNRCVIDNAHNMLILHPDQLISSTVVADSFGCTRRAVLQDRVKATSDSSPALVYGTLLHEIFQEALMANKWDPYFLGSVIDKAIKKHIEDLYVIKVEINDAREHLLSKMTELRHWAQLFVSSVPRPNAIVQGRNGEKVNMCVGKLLDVEEHVWSPMYGLKGNIDATVQVTMRDGREMKTLTVPFEVKTGKNVNSSHQAQTVLYNLLLSDRYDIEIVYGVLYYMETSQTMRVPAIRHELRHMIMQRNQLACHVRERSVQLPDMKRSKQACGRCYAQTSCFIYHRLADDGDGETSGMGETFDKVVKHLSPTHKEFFLKWEDLLTKEEKESQKLRRELWTMVSTEREKVGRCFSNVVIEEGSAREDIHMPKINRYQYTFIKDKQPAASFSFMESQLQVGEPIVVSSEQGHFALALGFVTAVRKRSISVAVDRRLHNARIRQPGFDETDNQVFASVMEVVPEGSKPEESQGKIKEAPVRYRLDKDEFSNGMATVRNNLVQVMAEGPIGSREIRSLVVDLEPPRFKAVSTQYTIADKGLNVDQRKAIEKVMSAEDYALVLGMPGTGKTTTIAHIIRALISQGKSVLLTSYTHTAVDNILLKLKTDNIPILRLGATAKVHSEVRDFVTLAGQPKETFDEIKQAWHGCPVVATTCLGINHPVFNERYFDYCIVDEASQITLPICLGPIRMAKTFVLVGDHNQLPPLVQNEEARLGGLDVSLFKLLSDTHPESVVNLEHQYRMCEDIMALSNTLIYHGRLKCGTEALKTRVLHVPNPEAIKQLHFDADSFRLHSASQQPGGSSLASFCPSPRSSSCWLSTVLSPSSPVLFLNTDTLQPVPREEAKGARIVNPAEARLVSALVTSLLTLGVPADEIGVMTHYRSQLALLKHHMGRTGVEMHTADRFQGRDKEVVILSLVRSNEACMIGDLLKDWRRINVAFTRAKTKLIVVGSKSTLGGCGEEEMLCKFVKLMEGRRWTVDLPRDALEGHLFENPVWTGTAGTMSGMSPEKKPAKKVRVVSPAKTGSRGFGKENIRPGGAAVKSPKKVIRVMKVGERAVKAGSRGNYLGDLSY